MMESLTLTTFKAYTGEFRTAHGFFVPLHQTGRLHGARHAAYDDGRPLYVALLVAPLDGRRGAQFLRRAEVLIGPMLWQVDHTFVSQEGTWRQHPARGLRETHALRLIMPHVTDRSDEDFAIDAASIAHTLGAGFRSRNCGSSFSGQGSVRRYSR